MVSKKRKTFQFKITADLVIDSDFVSDDDIPNFEKNLTGQHIKVKSGLYENIGVGWITKVEQTIPRKAR